MRVDALAHFSTDLHSINWLTITFPPSQLDPQPLERYLAAALQTLQGCTNLTKLVLDFDKKMVLPCNTAEWHFPKSIRDFSTLQEAHNVLDFPALLLGLHRLCIRSNTGSVDAMQIIKKAPNLLYFSLPGPRHLQIDCVDSEDLPPEEEEESELFLLQQRISGGLEFAAPMLRFAGPCKAIGGIIEQLPILASSHNVLIECEDIPDVWCLINLARAFPNLGHLTVVSHMRRIGVGAEMLAPLAACSLLKELRMHFQIKYTTSDLAALCVTLPGLQVFGYTKIRGVSLSRLKRVLNSHGRVLEVTEYSFTHINELGL